MLQTNLFEVIQAAHNCGLSVFPVKYKDKRPLVADLPSGKWESFTESLPEQGFLDYCFDSLDISPKNYGVICGPVSGNLVVIDIDNQYETSKKDVIIKPAKEIYSEFYRVNSEHLQETLIVRTGSGGYHIYFKVDDLPEKNITGAIFQGKKSTIDVKAGRGYVVGPGSIHSSGRSYETIQGDFESIATIQSIELLSVKPPVKKGGVRPDGGAGHSPSETFRQALQYAMYQPESVSGAGGHDQTFSVACAIAKGFNQSIDNTYRILVKYNEKCNPAWTEEELRHKSKDAWNQPGPVGYLINKSGVENSPFTRIENALDSLIEIRYNEVLAKHEYKQPHELSWSEFQMRDENSLYIDIYNYMLTTDSGVKGFTRDHFNVYVNSNQVELYHPFKHYYSGLTEHDGHDYIKDLAKCFKTDTQSQADAYWYLKKWLCGVVAQGIEKGSNHLCFVLTGPQGIGKTTFFRNLMFDKKYIHDGHIDPKNKDHLFFIVNKLIINLDDFEDIIGRYTERGYLKSLMSQDMMDLRQHYGKRNESIKRRASFCGSINDSQFLEDQTGSRRWLVVKVDDIDYEAQLKIPIDKIWAQAYALYKSGFQYWLTKEENKEISLKNQRFQVERADDFYILRALEPCEKTDPGRLFRTTTEIHNMLEDKFSKRIRTSNNLLNKILNKHGFKRHRWKENEKYFRGWIVKVSDPALQDDTDRPDKSSLTDEDNF